MIVFYRKRGRVVRVEGTTLVRIHEAGEAIEDDGIFMCRPFAHAEPLPEIDASRVQATARAIAPLAPERMIVSEGHAEHEYGDVRWEEHSERVHVALVHRERALRATVDLFALDAAPVLRVAEALARVGDERDAPARLRVAEHVRTALLPSLPNVKQCAGGIDGKGQPIVDASGEPWPNWYRPSYRVRPVRMPMNLCVPHTAAPIDPALPEAIALLAPPRSGEVRVLVDDRGEVYPTTVRFGHFLL